MLVTMAGACDWASVHFYADDVTRFGFSGAELLQDACAACNATGLSLYVGEFGDDKSKGGGARVSQAVLQFLSASTCAALVQPATIWVWGEFRQLFELREATLLECQCWQCVTCAAELWQQNGTYALYPDDAGECFHFLQPLIRPHACACLLCELAFQRTDRWCKPCTRSTRNRECGMSNGASSKPQTQASAILWCCNLYTAVACDF